MQHSSINQYTMCNVMLVLTGRKQGLIFAFASSSSRYVLHKEEKISLSHLPRNLMIRFKVVKNARKTNSAEFCQFESQEHKEKNLVLCLFIG